MNDTVLSKPQRAPRHAWVRSAIPFVCLALLAACATTMTGRKQLVLIDDQQMSALGASAFEDLKGQAKIDRGARVNTYVSCVADAIIDVAPTGGAAPDSGWEIVVFQDPTPNAFALPGGKIGVHTGMLEVATTPGQLASVIGHEIAHVLLRHGNERLSQTTVTQTLLEAGSFVLGDMKPQQKDIVLGGLGLGAQYGALLPFSRKHESEADVVGQQLMAEAGFDPAEAIAVWEKMDRLSEGAQPPELLSTHPSHGTRITDLRANLADARTLYQAARAAGRAPRCTAP